MHHLKEDALVVAVVDDAEKGIVSSVAVDFDFVVQKMLPGKERTVTKTVAVVVDPYQKIVDSD